MDERRLAEAAERLSRTLTADDLDETLRRITRGAVECLPDVDHASITIRHADGRLETVAPTDPVAAEMDAAQIELQEGPCYIAATDATPVVSPDLAQDERFPKYAAVAAVAGIHAQAGLRLFRLEESNGALDLYSRTPGAFADLDELGEIFAQQSVLALKNARDMENLRAATRSTELVGRAVGIAMERYGFTEQGAFAFLTRLADYHNAELPRVAEAVITASEQRAD